MRSAPDLFIRQEAYAHAAVRNLRVCRKVRHSGHNLGDAGLVVGAQQRPTVRRQERLSDVAGQLGEFARRQNNAIVTVQHDIAAVIALHDLRLNVLAGEVRSGVHMREEADCRHRFIRRCGERRHHIAILIPCDLGQSDFPQLGLQPARKLQLSRVEGHVSLSSLDWVSIPA